VAPFLPRVEDARGEGDEMTSGPRRRRRVERERKEEGRSVAAPAPYCRAPLPKKPRALFSVPLGPRGTLKVGFMAA
jgi:hypothetical protein